MLLEPVIEETVKETQEKQGKRKQDADKDVVPHVSDTSLRDGDETCGRTCVEA